MYCVHCGKSNEEGTQICAFCGKPLNDHTQLLEILDGPIMDEAPKPLKPEQPFCVHCGKPNDASSTLCAFCGKPLNDCTQLLEILDTPLKNSECISSEEPPKAFCVHCGRPNDPNEALCAFCGKPLNDRTQLLEILEKPIMDSVQPTREEPLVLADAPKYCWHCGQSLFEGSAFCALCGAPVDGPTQQQSCAAPGIPLANEKEAQPKTDDGMKFVAVAIVVAALVILVAIIITLFYVLR